MTGSALIVDNVQGQTKNERFTARFHEGATDEELASEFGHSEPYVRILRQRLNLYRIKTAQRPDALSVPRRRKTKKYTDKIARMPAHDHPALTEARTIYPATVDSALNVKNVLIDGRNHWKIGAKIIKGKWSGFPVFTLTLEERKTCPESCKHWRSCYGNHMHLANRISHDKDFEERLGHELALLNYRYPKGFAVRLHILGDFYSVDYVKLWAGFLDKYAALHVFGFSARWDMKRDPIADELVRLVMARWNRFAIRFSNAPLEQFSTISVEHEKQVPEDTVLCPQQMGQTQSCGTCAFCWSSQKRVAFLQH